jgi:hypothetical protein
LPTAIPGWRVERDDDVHVGDSELSRARTSGKHITIMNAGVSRYQAHTTTIASVTNSTTV